MGYIGNAPYQGVVDSGNILDGSIQSSDIANSAITSNKLANEVTTLISQGGGPKITGIQVTNSSYTVLDDTAVDIAGGYIKLTGTGFASGCQVLVNSIAAASTTFVSSTEVRAQLLPTTAGTYVVYLVNADGGVAIRVNGITFSAVPSWTTTSSLTSSTTVNIQLQASGASTFSLATGSTLPSGLTLSSSGLLSGTITGLTQDTTYSFTVNAIDAENQDSPRTFSLAVTITIPDPYFEYVTLLLSGQGTNLKQNNEFLDSSTANSGTGWTITRNPATGPNAPTQGTFSPFSQTGWGNYFNGSSQYLSTPDSTAFTMGSGDFTVEAWVYKTSTGRQFITGQSDSSGANTSVSFALQVTASNKISGSINSGATEYAATSTADIVLNQWNHIAFVRDGNTSRIYVNGNQDGTASVTGITANDSTNQLAIGRLGEYNGLYWTGYISNCRIVKGRCVYPSGTTFNPPTAPLTRTTGGTNPPQGTECSLLTCQSNRFLDSNGVNTPASSPLTITPNGSPTVDAFSPFNPTASWSAATYGGSGYFDGSGDYLTAPSNTAFAFGTGVFTIEAWVYLNSTAGANIFQDETTNSYQFYVNTSSKLEFTVSGVAVIATSSASIVANQWNHVAVVREGTGTNQVKLYINGGQDGSGTSATSLVNSATNYIGRTGTGTRQLNGYLSDLRIVKGTAVYTAAFTPPTAPLTATQSANTNGNPSAAITGSATSLLLNFTNAGIYDATSKNDLETVGDAKISTAISAKWGSGSMYFNGTTDYLTASDNPLYDVGSGNWTIELWANFSSVSGEKGLVSHFEAGSPNKGLTLRLSTSNSPSGLRLVVSTTTDTILQSAWSPSTSVWYYIAAVRSGNTLSCYVDGNLIGTTSITGAVGNPNALFAIGTAQTVASSNMSGYIQDVRITRYARTITASPTAAFPTL